MAEVQINGGTIVEMDLSRGFNVVYSGGRVEIQSVGSEPEVGLRRVYATPQYSEHLLFAVRPGRAVI